jgi:hypothetical protein
VDFTPEGIPVAEFTSLISQSGKFFSGDFAGVVCAALADPWEASVGQRDHLPTCQGSWPRVSRIAHIAQTAIDTRSRKVYLRGRCRNG